MSLPGSGRGASTIWMVRPATNCTLLSTRPVLLTMSSEEVLHSLYIPAFRVKQDLVPGRYTKMWFRAIEPGTYPIYCAEYCGTNHSRMLSKVIVSSGPGFLCSVA